MAKKSTIPPHIRKILAKQSREMTRRSSKQALEELEDARRELRLAERINANRTYRQTSSAILTAMMGMTSAVARSWGISNPIYLKAQTYGDNLSAATDFKSVRIRYPMKSIKVANSAEASDKFNVSQLKIVGNDIRALVYHEVGHIRFTTPLPDLITLAGAVFDPHNDPLASEVHRAWNMLEDQRMEAAVVSESPVIAQYFTTLVLRWLLNQREEGSQTAASQWLLIVGRRYIPIDIRRDMRNQFRDKYGADAVRRASEIVRRYMSATDAATMFGAVMDMQRLLKSIQVHPNGIDMHENAMRPRGGGLTKGRTDEEERQRLSDSATNDEEDEPVDDGTAADSSQGDGEAGGASEIAGAGDTADDDDAWPTDGQSEQSDGDGDDDVATTAGGADHITDDAAPDDLENNDRRDRSEANDSEPYDADSSDGKSAGNGKRSDEPKPPTIQELLDDSLSHIEEDEVLQDLVRSVNENILNAGDSLPKDTVWTHQQDDAAAKAEGMAIDIAAALRAFTADNEPLWQSRTNRGYIDPFAYRTRSSGSSDYRRTLEDEGNTGSDVSVTVMLDTSSSMEGTESALGVVAYACKRACEIIDVPCAVMTFDSDGHLLWDKDDEARQVSLNTDGGTSPQSNFEALDSFRYDKNTHLVLMMTDGAFGFKGCNHYRSEGRYFVGLAYGVGASVDSLRHHEFDAAQPIKDLAVIPDILRDFLASFLR